MALKTWTALIRLNGGSQQRVQVDADTQQNAKKMLEAQYGSGCIIGSPTPA